MDYMYGAKNLVEKTLIFGEEGTGTEKLINQPISTPTPPTMTESKLFKREQRASEIDKRHTHSYTEQSPLTPFPHPPRGITLIPPPPNNAPGGN